jgi:hypothetical protein
VGGLISSVIATDCGHGLYVQDGAEHLSVSHAQFLSNDTGLFVAGGNFLGVGLQINSNTIGVELGPGDNGGHGLIANSQILHNQGPNSAGYAVRATGLTIGFNFAACNFTSERPIELDSCRGIAFDGGQMFGTTPLWKMAGSASGQSFVRCMRFHGGTEPNVTGAPAQIPYLEFHGCTVGGTGTCARNT